jgi:uncharacterized membrane protein
MSPRALKIGLGVSLALNLFLVGALVAGLVVGQRELKARGFMRHPPLFVAARSLPEADQQRLREQMRSAADAARPDFRAAREARREAVALASAQQYDASAVRTALSRSHASEVAGRAKLDARLTDLMATMTPEARKALAPSLGRGLRGPRMKHEGRGRRGEGPPPPPAE